MSKENLIITGKTIDELILSSNQIIQRLVNKISELEKKLSNVKGESGKVENNVVRVVSDKNKAYIETVTSNGKYIVDLTRKE